MTQQRKQELYLDYVNNFLTVTAFAEYYNISEKQANKIIDETRNLRTENEEIQKFIKNYQSKNEYNPRFLDEYNTKFNAEFDYFLNNSNFSKKTINFFKS